MFKKYIIYLKNKIKLKYFKHNTAFSNLKLKFTNTKEITLNIKFKNTKIFKFMKKDSN